MVVNVVIITIDYIFIIIRLLLLVDGSLLYTVIYSIPKFQLDILKNDGSLMDLFWINLKQFMYCFVDPPAIFEF